MNKFLEQAIENGAVTYVNCSTSGSIFDAIVE